MPLPRHFCWTRFGTEAGEGVAQILTRKEQERVRNGGVFLWGIGNAIGPSMRQLIRVESEPEVVFSPIRSAPRKEDSAPEKIVRWTAGRTMSGQRYELPAASIVTSRFKPDARRSIHYALVCNSSAILCFDPNGETVSFGKLRNLITHRAIGASQVTAIVTQAAESMRFTARPYPVAMRAHLVFPYFIELLDPVPVREVLYGKEMGACPSEGNVTVEERRSVTASVA